MSSRTRRAATVLAICCVAVSCGQTTKNQRSIELEVLEDKVRGGWAGQMIGVSFGEPTEFKYLGEDHPRGGASRVERRSWCGALDQDDLYVDMTFAAVLDDKGSTPPPRISAPCSGTRSTDCGTPTWRLAAH